VKEKTENDPGFHFVGNSVNVHFLKLESYKWSGRRQCHSESDLLLLRVRVPLSPELRQGRVVCADYQVQEVVHEVRRLDHRPAEKGHCQGLRILLNHRVLRWEARLEGDSRGQRVPLHHWEMQPRESTESGLADNSSNTSNSLAIIALSHAQFPIWKRCHDVKANT